MKRALVVLLAVLITSATSLFAQPQQPFALTIDMIMKGPQFAGYEPRDLRWAPDGQHLFFRWKQYTQSIEKDFDTYVVGRDGKGLRKLTDEEAKDAPPIRGYWSRDHKRAVSIDDGDVVLYENNKPVAPDGRHRDRRRSGARDELPPSVSIHTAPLTYESKATFDGNMLHYRREFTVLEHAIPVSGIEEVNRAFAEDRRRGAKHGDLRREQ